jgi:hypothetical protein
MQRMRRRAAHARKVMQQVLDQLAHARRLPVLG